MYLVYITKHHLPLTTQYWPVMFVGMKNLKQSGTHIHVLSLNHKTSPAHHHKVHVFPCNVCEYGRIWKSGTHIHVLSLHYSTSPAPHHPVLTCNVCGYEEFETVWNTHTCTWSTSLTFPAPHHRVFAWNVCGYERIWNSLEHTYMYLVYITQHPLPITTKYMYSPVMFVSMKEFETVWNTHTCT